MPLALYPVRIMSSSYQIKQSDRIDCGNIIERMAALDWADISSELDAHGCAVIGPLTTANRFDLTSEPLTIFEACVSIPPLAVPPTRDWLPRATHPTPPWYKGRRFAAQRLAPTVTAESTAQPS